MKQLQQVILAHTHGRCQLGRFKFAGVRPHHKAAHIGKIRQKGRKHTCFQRQHVLMQRTFPINRKLLQLLRKIKTAIRGKPLQNGLQRIDRQAAAACALILHLLFPPVFREIRRKSLLFLVTNDIVSLSKLQVIFSKSSLKKYFTSAFLQQTGENDHENWPARVWDRRSRCL